MSWPASFAGKRIEISMARGAWVCRLEEAREKVAELHCSHGRCLRFCGCMLTLILRRFPSYCTQLQNYVTVEVLKDSFGHDIYV